MFRKLALVALAGLLAGPAAANDCDRDSCFDTCFGCCADGVDNDGDTSTDCDDEGCAVACVPPEDCSGGIDEDGDGLVDCADSDCAGDPDCPPPGEVCNNGEDDDEDGLTDCEDEEECPPCVTEDDCTNGEDDDEDGLTDCDDTADCNDVPDCQEDNCVNGVDDDEDGQTDCQDFDCVQTGCCAQEICDDLCDNNGDTLIDCEDEDRCIDADECNTEGEEEDCTDEDEDGRPFDNDGDQLANCDDPQCVRHPACGPPGPCPPPPGVTIAPSDERLACLWPANHAFRCFPLAGIPVAVSGACGPVTITYACSSDQPDNGPGSGNFPGDCFVTDDEICVRAERDGRQAEGRTYTILATATDAFEQSSGPVPVATVYVPRDRRDALDCLRPVVRSGGPAGPRSR